MSVKLNGLGSGDNPLAATANYNLGWAPANTVLIADGYGNVASSEILLESLSTPALPEAIDAGTY